MRVQLAKKPICFETLDKFLANLRSTYRSEVLLFGSTLQVSQGRIWDARGRICFRASHSGKQRRNLEQNRFPKFMVL